METYQKIVRGCGAILFPYKDSAAVQLVKNLLKANAPERV